MELPFGTEIEVRCAVAIDHATGHVLTQWVPSRVLRDYPGSSCLEVEWLDARGRPYMLRVARSDVLVTEPLPPTINHKVYAGEYVASTQSENLGLEVSAVIEGTKAGTILIGSSREHVGFERRVSLAALRAIASAALELFPRLAGVTLLRSYAGFRPYSPDHLPVVGADARLSGLWHATGHEGAGIGLSVGTAKLISQAMAGESTDIDLAPLSPARFEAVAPA